MDQDIQRIIKLILKKWKLLVLFAVIGALIAYGYTSKFVTPTYTSSIKFLAYVNDEEKEHGSANTQTASNTSKMNYAMNMIKTYLEVINTNNFYSHLTENLNKELGTSYSVSTVRYSVSSSIISGTAMFILTVTTTDATLSYNIAHQLEKDVPPLIYDASNSLVSVSVQDPPIFASSAVSLGYPKKMAIGAVIGFVIAAAYVILRDFLDVRIKNTEELVKRYNIPVLGTIPDYSKSVSGKKEG